MDDADASSKKDVFHCISANFSVHPFPCPLQKPGQSHLIFFFGNYQFFADFGAAKAATHGMKVVSTRSTHRLRTVLLAPKGLPCNEPGL
jgi:hypothetical protein